MWVMTYLVLGKGPLPLSCDLPGMYYLEHMISGSKRHKYVRVACLQCQHSDLLELPERPFIQGMCAWQRPRTFTRSSASPRGMFWVVQGDGWKNQVLQELVVTDLRPLQRGEPLSLRIRVLWVEVGEGALHLTWELRQTTAGT